MSSFDEEDNDTHDRIQSVLQVSVKEEDWVPPSSSENDKGKKLNLPSSSNNFYMI